MYKRQVTGRTTSLDEVGSATMHATVSGNVHFIAEDDRHAVQIAKALLSYLPSNNTEDPPHRPYPDLDLSPDEGINALIPETSSEPMDVKQIIPVSYTHLDVYKRQLHDCRVDWHAA